jgi:hypothetical protein
MQETDEDVGASRLARREVPRHDVRVENSNDVRRTSPRPIPITRRDARIG